MLIVLRIAMVILLIAPSVSSQVNVEDRRMSRQQSGLSGSVNLSIELERGNSELTEIGLRPRLVYRSGPSQWFMLNSYSFVETDEASVINEGFSHVRYNYDLTERLVLEALTQFQYNRSQDLRQRFLLGAGVRYELVNRTHTGVIAGATAMFEYEELESREIIRTPRNSDYLTIRLRASGTMTMRNTLYLQPAFDDPGDLRILDDFEMTVAISKWLGLTLALQYRYDSEPPAGIKEYDLSLKNGLTITF